MNVLETERLILRRMSLEDAEFMLQLLNEPSFLRFIGDKGVRTLDDARNYIRQGPMASYDRFGFGLYLTELKETGVPIGMCGLLKRDTLDDVDIGFAFVPQFWKVGYAAESAAAVMAYAKDVLGLNRLAAITSPENDKSISLLLKLGMSFQGLIKLTADAPEVKLFARDLSAPSAVAGGPS
jgi:RimJ/RimL family protein N-acetyltransferase